MDVSEILNNLNEAQRKAVTSESPHLLVLAGAGSGKTRVIAHRVAWLVQALDNSPHSLLTVTFTNKAANEMKGRIESMLGQEMADFWCGTFHGIAHRISTGSSREFVNPWGLTKASGRLDKFSGT